MANENWLPSVFGARGFEPDGLRTMRREMERLFDDFTAPFAKGGSGPTLHTDISETAGEVRVTAELPGVEQKDIDVTLAGDRLTIRGEKRGESEKDEDAKGRTYHRVERSYGMFERSLVLPFRADADAVTASFKDGVLTVTVKKPDEIKGATRKVAISSG